MKIPPLGAEFFLAIRYPYIHNEAKNHFFVILRSECI